VTGSGARHKPRATDKRNKGKATRNILAQRMDRQDKMRRTMRLAALLAAMTGIGVQTTAADPVDDTAADLRRGAVTNLPLPRYVSLKTDEGNARRGPGLTHRIDWVFKRAGMPLRITAEYENWRRVEDADGAGGWMHYSLLSGSRTALVNTPMLDLHSLPQTGSSVVLQAESGVVARLTECQINWCRMSIEGEKGWAPKAQIWGVDADEVFN